MNTSDAESSDETSLIEKEEDVNYIKDNKNKNMTRIKIQYSHMTLPVLIWRNM